MPSMQHYYNINGMRISTTLRYIFLHIHTLLIIHLLLPIQFPQSATFLKKQKRAHKEVCGDTATENKNFSEKGKSNTPTKEQKKRRTTQGSV